PPDGKRGERGPVRNDFVQGTGALRRETGRKRGKRFEVAQSMGWERGYYYRVRKVQGRVVREYVGTGRVAALVAQMDALERQERDAERAALRADRAELDALDGPVNELDDLADLVARAALLAACGRIGPNSATAGRRGRPGRAARHGPR